MLDEPLHVSGVGKSAQCATTAVSVDFDLGMLVDGHDSLPELGCTYTAPVIPNSQLPMLLWTEISSCQACHPGYAWKDS